MPAVEAPGCKRPITRNHAPTDWCSRAPSPAMRGSCCTGIQMSGGSLRKVSPKNPGGAMPITANGCPSTTKLEPTTEGSAPYSASQVWWLKMATGGAEGLSRSEEHTSELQSLRHLVCRLLLEKNELKSHPHSVRIMLPLTFGSNAILAWR